MLGFMLEVHTEWSQEPLTRLRLVGHTTLETHCVCPASSPCEGDSMAPPSFTAAGAAPPSASSAAVALLARFLRAPAAPAAPLARASSAASTTLAPAATAQFRPTDLDDQ